MSNPFIPDAEAKGNIGGTGFPESGIYKAQIITVATDSKEENGVTEYSVTPQLKLLERFNQETKNFEKADGEVIVYNMVTNKTFLSGKENFRYGATHEFLRLAGVKTGATAVKEVGRENKQNKNCLIEPEGKIVVVALQREFDVWENKRRTKMHILKTYEPSEIDLLPEHSKVLKDTETPEYKRWIENGGSAKEETSKAVDDAMQQLMGQPEVPTAQQVANAANQFEQNTNVSAQEVTSVWG